MTYNVFGGTLNLAQSQSQCQYEAVYLSWKTCMSRASNFHNFSRIAKLNTCKFLELPSL